MQSGSVVHVLFYLINEDQPDEKHGTIGVYSSETLAQMAIARLNTKPSFVHDRGEFQVHRAIIDQDGWVDGFVNEDLT